MFIVYVLKCRDNKYYVGRTMDLDIRIGQHENGNTKWTRIHPYEELIWEKRTTNNDLELAKTLEYMKRYRIRNVRGSTYSRPSLSDDEFDNIRYQLRHRCFGCGRFGHVINECKCDICGEYDHFSNECDKCYKCGGSHRHSPDNCTNCYKCQRPGHHYSECDRCYNCGNRGHFIRDCQMEISYDYN
ncbi:hypothetical protein RhiirA5_356441 [Rhizophagus irregularis]|uniref:Uncharacterized protein n=1 Tax=Rhizophagus irregularis TaxID=588596 RepID=A0A2N0PS72_9GLOM|nr:hypothetical protein RhiirA5_356441 [Rhizophagus irregularis]PKC66006.1 hypothetical protein RhiirA1_419830 [Rhizophagus irregularis]CAB4474966.1 unnamed protein product [Rhizophagus irregularis]CAB5198420.1 unnamed protein product [Rhizophagus irregularis]CAB5386693.1 unnamed protein product [Rhizophagus irregularis]